MRKALLVIIPFLIGVALLVLLFHYVDLRASWVQIRRIGFFGSALFILNIGVTFLAPAAGWHLLMRAEGIRISPRQTFISALMGHAFNLVTPMMYLGGEPIRTFYAASVAQVPKRIVVATIIVSKFQELAGLALLIVIGTGIMLSTSSLSGPAIAGAVVAGLVLTGFLVAVLSMILGNFKPTVRIIDLLMRIPMLRGRLESTRGRAEEMEVMVRDAFTKRWRVFILSQLLTMLSPLAQAIRPTLFYGLLIAADVRDVHGDPLTMPSLAQLCVVFVLSQVSFLLPTTPAGLGVYEGILVWTFTLIGRPADDGGAFGILIRLADLLYIAAGSWLAIHYGMSSLLKRAVTSPPPIALPSAASIADGVPDAADPPSAPAPDGGAAPPGSAPQPRQP